MATPSKFDDETGVLARHYCLLAKCNKTKNTADNELQFRYI